MFISKSSPAGVLPQFSKPPCTLRPLCLESCVFRIVFGKPAQGSTRQLGKTIKVSTDAISLTELESPVGLLRLAAGDQGLRQILFPKSKPHADRAEHKISDVILSEPLLRTRDPGEPPRRLNREATHTTGREASILLKETIRQLRAYFSGKLEQFDLPLAPEGTPFQLEVWRRLCEIPYGETISYGELARRIGNPKASRAVGLANGSNPISIVIPCHRVIGSNGKLTGYGGGLPIKEKLLALERRQLRLL